MITLSEIFNNWSSKEKPTVELFENVAKVHFGKEELHLDFENLNENGLEVLRGSIGMFFQINLQIVASSPRDEQSEPYLDMLSKMAGESTCDCSECQKKRGNDGLPNVEFLN